MPILVTTQVFYLGIRINKPGTDEVLSLRTLELREENSDKASEIARNIVELLLDICSEGCSVNATLFSSDRDTVISFPELCRVRI